MFIKPTVGRVVWFWKEKPEGFEDQPQAAIVACVLSDARVNVAIFDASGVPVMNPPTSVPLVQEGQTPPSTGPYCSWMPNQVGQARAAGAVTSV